MTLDEAVYKIKTGTHRFIRHQYAWFRLKDERIKWFDVEKVTEGRDREGGRGICKELNFL